LRRRRRRWRRKRIKIKIPAVGKIARICRKLCETLHNL